MVSESTVAKILSLVYAAYPDWQGLQDPLFVKDEITYKRKACREARKSLGQEEFKRLLDAEEFEEIRKRLKKLATKTNLLNLRFSSTSDIVILAREDLDFPSFVPALYDLIHGEGTSLERFNLYLQFVTTHNFPNRWPFPTYFLFLFHPETEFFIKPEVTQAFLKLAGDPFEYAQDPEAEWYGKFLKLLGQIREELRTEGIDCHDMVELQSLIWVAVNQEKENRKQQDFADLWKEFRTDYAASEKGRVHLKAYEEARQVARECYAKVVEMERRGEDVTFEVIRGFLPYASSDTNRNAGRWIHPAPVFAGDASKKMEGKKWVKPGQWPEVAREILLFVKEVVAAPQNLSELCSKFAEKPFQGFQAGSLSPILNALDPEHFMVVNAKPIQVLDRFGRKRHGQSLVEYPSVNEDLMEFYREAEEEGFLQGQEMEGVLPSDVVDMFCHWLVAEKNYFKTRFWKIAPGKGAKYWQEWVEKGIAAVGWDETGDLSAVKSKTEFDKVIEACKKEQGLKDSDISSAQLWTFLKQIRPGDRLVANYGKSRVIGLGTVTGKYRFDPQASQFHVMDVVWDDIEPREVNEPGWVKTIVKLDREKFEAIEALPPIDPPAPDTTEVEKIFVEYYPDEADRRMVCELLADAVEAAHELNPKIWELSVRSDKIRLNVAFFAALDCKLGVFRISVLQEEVPRELAISWQRYENHRFHFKRMHEGATGYDLPVEEVRQKRELVGQLLRSFVVRASDGVNRSPYAKFHRQDVLQYLRAFLDRKLPDPELDQPDPVPGALFRPETFALLEGLEEEPTREFYQDRKDEIHTFVETPVQDLLYEVVKGLPGPMLEILETEKNVFSRIPKNDYGRGGAWSYYWGALYPRGGKRIDGCQLFISVDTSGLEAGFAFGGQASEDEKRFGENLRVEGGKLSAQIRENWSSGFLMFGDGQDQLKAIDVLLREWGSCSGESGVSKLKMFLPVEEALGWQKGPLVEKVRQLFVDLFPLVFFATEDEPMPSVLKWFDVGIVPELNPEHSLKAVSSHTGFPVATLECWKRSIRRKKQAVFYGPPGTGKTFIADHMARHLIGGGRGFAQVVQFHPSYAYEDFIEGIRPSVNGSECLVYTKERGVFLEFCRKAAEAEGDPCVLIVDEINRAPLSRVFGELMYLLEYRKQKIRLASGREFAIPGNVYLIGTMNTADRSIALVDHALRRRFAFISLFPDYGVLENFHRGNGFDASGLVKLLEEVNREIGDRNYSVGVSFFLDKHIEENIEDIWRMEVEPYLEEYFYDQNGRMEDFRWEKVRGKVFGTGI